jgi:hypothetical protein
MEYELNSVSSRRNPYTNRDGIYGLDVIIRTKIVNQTYNGFENLDSSFCPILKTDSINEIENKMTNFAVDFIKNKYPNT